MRISNPFQINDWGIKKFLKVVLAVQLALWGVIGFDALGLQIPILRQLIGFIYLTFIPGIIILRILKLHKLGNIETLLYTVGLSLFTLMFTGLLMNYIYPFFGISGPISLTPLIITISAVVLALCVLSYVRDKGFSDPSFIDVGEMLSPPALFLCLIPFLAIFGTYLVNFHHNNILLMFLIVILAIIALLIGFDKLIPKNLYPLAVFVIAISLLYHHSLISMYLTGWDIHVEYFFYKLVETNSFWDSTIQGNCNTALSITMLCPIYSYLLKMDGTWIFKIIYPFLFSLTTIGLYKVYQKQTDGKIAFLSVFFFMSLNTFYIEMVSLARQQIAEFFLVLLMLLLVNRETDLNKRVLGIVFVLGMIVSHYALSAIYMIIFVFALIALYLMNIKNKDISKNRYFITIGLILIFVVANLSWHMYITSSTVFVNVADRVIHIYSSIYTSFFNVMGSQPGGILRQESASPLHFIYKILHVLMQLFILIGVIKLILPKRITKEKMKFCEEYTAFSIVSFAIFSACFIIPWIHMVNIYRLYHIVLFFLAPFCVIGGIIVFRGFYKVLRMSWTNQSVKSSLKVLSVFFAIFLLFNTGWVYEVAKDYPGSISLSQEWIKECGSVKAKVHFYGAYIPEQDVVSARRLSKNRGNKTLVYADYSAFSGVLHSYGMIPDGYKDQLLMTEEEIRTGAYLFMSYINIIYNTIHLVSFEKSRVGSTYNTTDFEGLLKKNCKIYSNGGSDIYVNG